MGLFDDINFKTKCPVCGEIVDGFQSKDGPCMLDTLEFWEVSHFYSHCPKCETWIEFNLKQQPRPNRELTIDDYEMIFRKN